VGRGETVRAPRTETAAGSVLIEVIVGIGMLAVLTTTLATFDRSWHGAAEASAVRTEALRLAIAHVESETSSDATREPVRAHSGHRALVSVAERWSSAPAAAAPCTSSGAGRIRGTVVTVSSADRVDDPLLQVIGTRLDPHQALRAPLHSVVPGNVIRIEGSGLAGMGVLVDSGGEQTIGVVGEDGCLDLPPLRPGSHVLRPVVDGSGPMPVDASHRTGGALRLDVSVLDRPVFRRWSLSEQVQVTVDIDPSAGRPPDVVEFGALRWMVRGDDAREAVGLGSARPLHPGPTTVVVSACGDPEAFASSSTVDVVPGPALHVLVPLATVTLRGLDGRAGDVVRARRTTACADGGTHPRIRWVGGLTDGMQVALPHGEWEVWLENIAGDDLVTSRFVRAGASGTEVTFL